MSYIDAFVLIVLIFGAVRGFSKGLLLELTTLLSLLFGVYGARRFSKLVESHIREDMQVQSEYLGVIAFGLTFLGVVIVVMVIGKGLTKVVSSVGLGLFNKALGAVFGALKFGLVLGVIVSYLLKFNGSLGIFNETQVKRSVAVAFLSRVEPDVLHRLEQTKKKAGEVLEEL